MPGITKLNVGGNAAVTAISCTAPGYCTAGGYYTSAAHVSALSSASTAFVVSEVKGRWGAARQVPGLGPAGLGDWASVNAISCASPGNCLAGGYDGTNVRDSSGSRAFVASEVNGTWETARHYSSGRPGEITTVTSVSCSKAGDCLAGGYTLYPVNEGGGQFYDFGYEFVAGQQDGNWSALRALTAVTLLYRTPASLTCLSPGNCAVSVGGILNPTVAQEKGGTWHTTTLPGYAVESVDASQAPTVVACSKAGDCTAGGTYFGLRSNVPLVAVWVDSESGYRWEKGTDLPGLPKNFYYAIVNAISCAAPGDCTLAGQFWTPAKGTAIVHGFTAAETGGRWSSARVVVSGAAGNVSSISCPAVGYCVAGVQNSDYAPHVIEEAGGTWEKPLALPGLTHSGLVNWVSCAKPGWCAAGGSYSVGGQNQAVIANETVA